MIDPSNVTLPLAMLAGLLSFVSPCVLPLVPAYIGYLTSQAANTVSASLVAAAEGGAPAPARPSRWMVFLHGVFFVLGFSLIFVLVIGISAGAIGEFSRRFLRASDWILRIGGLLIIILALHTMGVIRIPFLYYDTRRQAVPHPEWGFLGSALMGVTFAAGWSPCLGPILAAMMTLGASTGSVGRAAILLSAYALGLGIPFLLTALLLDRAVTHLRKIQRFMRPIEIASGLFLLLIGVLVFSGTMQSFFARFAGSTDLAIAVDRWLVNLVSGAK